MSSNLKSPLEQLGSEIAIKRAEVTALYDTIGDNEPTSEQLTAVKDANKLIEELETKYANRAEIDLGRQVNQRRINELKTNSSDRRDFGDPTDRRTMKSLGDEVFDDPAFKSWMGDMQRRGGPPGKTEFKSPTVEVKSLITGASETSGGAFVRREYSEDVPMPMRMLTLRDVVTVATTGSDMVEYVRQTTRTNNAAVVAEATATYGSSGTSPESALGWEVVQDTVKDITTWVPATSRALADDGQLRALIENELRYMVGVILEGQMLAGDGAGGNFTGISVASGLTTQAYTSSLLTTTRKARTKAKTSPVLVQPNAWLMNPSDWETFDLLVDNENRYYMGGPAVLGNPRLWGIPVIEHEDVPAGRAFLSDFRQTCWLWDRQQAQILASNSHGDFFIRQIHALLAIQRAAFGVKRPAGIIDVDLTA